MSFFFFLSFGHGLAQTWKTAGMGMNGLWDDEDYMMNGLWDDEDNVTQNPSLHHPLETCYDSLVNEQCSCS
jgi:hypothetical protein